MKFNQVYIFFLLCIGSCIQGMGPTKTAVLIEKNSKTNTVRVLDGNSWVVRTNGETVQEIYLVADGSNHFCSENGLFKYNSNQKEWQKYENESLKKAYLENSLRVYYLVNLMLRNK